MRELYHSIWYQCMKVCLKFLCLRSIFRLIVMFGNSPLVKILLGRGKIAALPCCALIHWKWMASLGLKANHVICSIFFLCSLNIFTILSIKTEGNLFRWYFSLCYFSSLLSLINGDYGNHSTSEPDQPSVEAQSKEKSQSIFSVKYQIHRDLWELLYHLYHRI